MITVNTALRNGINGVKMRFKSVDFAWRKVNQTKEWFLAYIAKRAPEWITPNRLSGLRIFFAGLIILILINFRYAGSLVVWLFIASVITDLFDGPIARVRDCASQKGAFLDRLGDKLLICTLVTATVWSYDKPLVIIIVVSEIISLSIAIAAMRRNVSTKSNWFGKWKMAGQSTGIFILLFFPQAMAIATKTLWVALGLGLASLVGHFQTYVLRHNGEHENKDGP